MKKKKWLVFTPPEVGVIVFTLLIAVWLSWSNLERGWQLQRDINRKSDLGILSRALSNYYQIYEVFPRHSENFEVMGCGPEASMVCLGGHRWEDGAYIYLDSFPVESLPLSGRDWPSYGYRTNQAQNSFWLWAFLEREKDIELVSSQENCPGSWAKNQYVICHFN